MKHSETVLDHFKHPRNAGILDDPDGVASAYNPQCGDTTRLYLKIEDGVIIDARWQTQGCGTAIAASSIVSVLLKGKQVDEAAQVKRKEIAHALGGLPPAKVHCSVLAADAVQAALADYRTRKEAVGSG